MIPLQYRLNILIFTLFTVYFVSYTHRPLDNLAYRVYFGVYCILFLFFFSLSFADEQKVAQYIFWLRWWNQVIKKRLPSPILEKNNSKI